mmetsp:Transcript_16132/g.34915  ORF Transcript_16132/g.34915 Transcript_16132/m.34915 type:complete len:98 (-) Transcript_16132:631-924(-)
MTRWGQQLSSTCQLPQLPHEVRGVERIHDVGRPGGCFGKRFQLQALVMGFGYKLQLHGLAISANNSQLPCPTSQYHLSAHGPSGADCTSGGSERAVS